MWRLAFVSLSLGLVLSGAASVLPQGKGEKKSDATISIRWYGQSFFQIVSSKGTRIVIDPHAIDVYPRPKDVKADVVLMSHFHTDHTRVDVIANVNEKTLKDGSVQLINGLKGSPKNPQWNIFDKKIKDVHIRSVGLYHDDMEGLKYGRVAAFVIEMDGWRIVHLGDLGHTLSTQQLKKIGPVDVLMIPVGGIYTLNGEDAKKVVDQIKPKEFILPMHCGTRIYDELLQPTEFFEQFAKANVTTSDDNQLLLTEARKTEDRPRPTVVWLNFEPKEKKEKEKEKEKEKKVEKK